MHSSSKHTVKYITVIFIFQLANIFSINAQKNHLKVHEFWKTNKEKTLIDLNELLIYTPKNSFSSLNNPLPNLSDEVYSDLTEIGIFIEINSTEKFYPLNIIQYHQVINDWVETTPISITYCPLSSSLNVFKRELITNNIRSTVSLFPSGMVRKGNIILADQNTESYWQQMTGKALVGEYANCRLEKIPFLILTYKNFKKAYPHGLIIKKPLNTQYQYEKNFFAPLDLFPLQIHSSTSYSTKKPIGKTAQELVLSLNINDSLFTFPYEYIKQKKCINKVLAGNYITIFWQEFFSDHPSKKTIYQGFPAVYSSFIDGERLIFQKKDSIFIDKQTLSKWTFLGKCYSGFHKGKKLKKVISTSSLSITANNFKEKFIELKH